MPLYLCINTQLYRDQKGDTLAKSSDPYMVAEVSETAEGSELVDAFF